MSWGTYILINEANRVLLKTLLYSVSSSIVIMSIYEMNWESVNIKCAILHNNSNSAFSFDVFSLPSNPFIHLLILHHLIGFHLYINTRTKELKEKMNIWVRNSIRNFLNVKKIGNFMHRGMWKKFFGVEWWMIKCLFFGITFLIILPQN